MCSNLFERMKNHYQQTNERPRPNGLDFSCNEHDPLEAHSEQIISKWATNDNQCSKYGIAGNS